MIEYVNNQLLVFVMVMIELKCMLVQHSGVTCMSEMYYKLRKKFQPRQTFRLLASYEYMLALTSVPATNRRQQPGSKAHGSTIRPVQKCRWRQFRKVKNRSVEQCKFRTRCLRSEMRRANSSFKSIVIVQERGAVDNRTDRAATAPAHMQRDIQ